MAGIEEITKMYVAATECTFDFVDQSIKALDGNGMLPDEVSDRLTDYLSNVDKVLYKMVEDTSYCSSDNYGIEYIIVRDIKEKKGKVSVALGDFTPLEVTGKKKMWTYTEMLSGYTFTATLDRSDKEGLIVVGFTNECDKNISKKLEKAINRFNKAYEKKTDDGYIY